MKGVSELGENRVASSFVTSTTLPTQVALALVWDPIMLSWPPWVSSDIVSM